MSISNVKFLIGNNKLKESIDLLKGICVGALSIYEPQLILLEARYTQHNKDEIEGIDPHEHINELRKSLLSFVYKIETTEFNQIEIQSLLSSSLLLNNSFPFVDRKKFRETIDEALSSGNAHIFLVEGPSKSGMSHLEKFLKHLSNNLKLFKLIPFEIPVILDEPNSILGEKLAKYMSYALGIKVNFDENENEQFKFIQFFNNLKKQIKSEEKIPLFFLHDFHKIQNNNENLMELMHMLITSINSDFPKSLFIIAGLNYKSLRNWHNDLKFTTKIYKIETVKSDDLNECLKKIFSEYKSRIREILGHDITEEEYVEEMKNQLTGGTGEVNIEKVGIALADHLFTLKN